LTDLAIRTDNAAAVAVPTMTPTMASLADWAGEARAAATLAESICKTSFVPEHFRGKPHETAAAILTGHELGLSPMAAVRSIFVIKGTPGMYAKAMVAVVQSRGHQVWAEEQSDERVVMCGRRKGTSEIVRTTWDRARVEKNKLTGNAKYQESPQQMMVARGQAEICRQIAADALHGVPYAAEELEDMPAIRVEPARVTRAAEVLGVDGDATEEPSTDEGVVMMTGPQSRKLFALLKEKGYSDRDRALVFIAGVVGREIDSRNELTKQDAMDVIDALEQLGEAA
jgi:hypothetical protein